jgi:hypothetical protein
MTLNISAAHDYETLLLVLKRSDLTVSPRTRGRTALQTEIWTIRRLLATLAQAGKLPFPVTVIHRDRPDFMIRTERATIGVEVTEAIPRQFAEFSALAEREYPDALLELAHFRWDGPKRKVPEMRALLAQSRLSSDGWVGDDPERESRALIEREFLWHGRQFVPQTTLRRGQDVEPRREVRGHEDPSLLLTISQALEKPDSRLSLRHGHDQPAFPRWALRQSPNHRYCKLSMVSSRRDRLGRSHSLAIARDQLRSSPITSPTRAPTQPAPYPSVASAPPRPAASFA